MAFSFDLRCIVFFLVIAAIPSICQSVPNSGRILDDAPISELAGPDVQAVVLIFASTDCPISNRYIPEIARLNSEFANKHVRIWWVFPNADDSAARVALHLREFSMNADAILDTRQALVRMAGVHVTPEAAVFSVAGGQLHEAYHGRIDDRYVNLGLQRPRAEHHDLEDAIAAVLDGKPVPQPAGPPVGCSIVFLDK